MKDNSVYLDDILKAIEQIEYYLKDIDFTLFDNHKMTQDAVIRQMAIIGEAMGKLSGSFSKMHPDLPVKESIAMRNILVHDYDWVDTKEVWKTAQKDLPKLKKVIKKIIKNFEF